MRSNLIKGNLGEKIAEKYLTSKGYRVLEKNYRIKTGEIDLIALKNNLLVFVEVKARTGLSYGYPYEAVHRQKQRKIIKTALYYMKSKNMNLYQPRFDIVEVYLGNKKGVNHIENAFSI